MKIPFITLAALQPLHERVVELVRCRDNSQRRPLRRPGAVLFGGYFGRAIGCAGLSLRQPV